MAERCLKHHERGMGGFPSFTVLCTSRLGVSGRIKNGAGGLDPVA